MKTVHCTTAQALVRFLDLVARAFAGSPALDWSDLPAVCHNGVVPETKAVR